jgi:hypothetical protein
MGAGHAVALLRPARLGLHASAGRSQRPVALDVELRLPAGDEAPDA